MQGMVAITRRCTDGATLRLMGAERAERRRAIFGELVHALPKRPEPVEAFRNFGRERATSFEQFVRIETAAVRASKPEAVVRYVGRIAMELLGHIIAPADPLENVLRGAEDRGHVAQRQQRLLAQYVQSGNALGLQRVMETVTEHEIALQRVRQTAQNALRSLETPACVLPFTGARA